ncbi:MAG: matrixin family metalloprotease [Tumebacillaceae bacterium]
MKLAKLVSSVIAFAIVTAPFAAHAYTLYPYWWQNGGAVSYKWGSNLTATGTIIRSGFENAIFDWNGTPTRVAFTYNSSSPNTLDSVNQPESSDYGWCYVYYNGTAITSFVAQVNSGASNITINNVARSAAGHELGHSLGLDHTNVYYSLMNPNRSRSSIYTPQTDDINGLNQRY